MKTQIHSVVVAFDEVPIVALCTPRGSGSIAMIRVSGVGALALVDRCAKISGNTSLAESPTHHILHGHIVDAAREDALVDEVLFLVMRSPKTFTGDDTVEITCHNNSFIIDWIIALAIRQGARQAQPGEFSKRAYLNGKIDLIQAEAIHELVHATSLAAVQASLQQLKGSLSSYIHRLEQQVIELLALVESSFEFLDEEQRDLDFDLLVRTKLDELLAHMTKIKRDFSHQQHIREGARVALLGAVNAGKSTLFNALLGRERAIVSEFAGTTRDTIEAGVYKDGVFMTLVDTAGLRSSHDVIEQLGIERSWQEAAKADLVMLVLDVSAPMSTEEKNFYQQLIDQHGKKIIFVANKIDRQHDESYSYARTLAGGALYPVEALRGIGVSELQSLMSRRLNALFATVSSPYLLNQRHYAALAAIEEILEKILGIMRQQIPYELVGYHLNEIMALLGAMTGKNLQEKVFDQIFSSFCVGK